MTQCRNINFLAPPSHSIPVLLAPWLFTGCVIVLGDGSGLGDASGPSDGNRGGNGSSASGSTGGDARATLPDPEQWRVEAPVLTPEQQKRKLEADAHIANVVYNGRPIVKTVQGYSGVIYDYIEVPPLDIDLPDLTTLLPDVPADGIQLGLTEVQRYAELSGPAGSTVFVRPDFSKYIMEETGATSIVDWLDNHQVAGIPNGKDRLYAGLNIPAANRGVFARINAFTPRVEKGSMSVVELAVACPATGPYTEMAGIMLIVDWANYHHPPKLELNVEWWRELDGVKVGSFGKGQGHFIEHRFRPADVGAPLDEAYISTPGGEQWEHALMMIMAPNGDWLFSYNYEYLGKYPASLFKVLTQGACRAQVYAEVYNPHPELGWVRTEMGSGQFPNAPGGHVAWIRQIRYLDLNSWLPLEPPSDDPVHWSQTYEDTCYQRSALVNQGSAGPLMLFGGPGGYRPECAAIKPSP